MNTNNREYSFSEEEIASFIQTMQDFKDGKTTARDWTEIEEELNQKYGAIPPEKST
jgi:hypothetical protein